MLIRKLIAMSLALALAVMAVPHALVAQAAKAQIGGTAKDEARKPYEEFQVRARVADGKEIVATTGLDQQAGFMLTALNPGKYMVELYNTRERKVVCAEGPFEIITPETFLQDVEIDCGRVPVAWLLLAAAAGITTGIVTRGEASPSK